MVLAGWLARSAAITVTQGGKPPPQIRFTHTHTEGSLGVESRACITARKHLTAHWITNTFSMMVGGKRSPGTATAEIITLQSLSGRIAEMPSIQHTWMGDMDRTTVKWTPTTTTTITSWHMQTLWYGFRSKHERRATATSLKCTVLHPDTHTQGKDMYSSITGRNVLQPRNEAQKWVVVTNNSSLSSVKVTLCPLGSWPPAPSSTNRVHSEVSHGRLGGASLFLHRITRMFPGKEDWNPARTIWRLKHRCCGAVGVFCHPEVIRC